MKSPSMVLPLLLFLSCHMPQVQSCKVPPRLAKFTGVPYFEKVDEALWRGNQPNREGFQSLEKAGVRTVINLRGDHDDLPLMKGLQMKYLRIPSKTSHLNDDNIALFLKVMENRENWPVFIHCAQGRDRTGYNVAAYRIAVQGWKPEAALQEMRRYLSRRVRIGQAVIRMDAAQLKAKAAAAPTPAFQTPAP